MQPSFNLQLKNGCFVGDIALWDGQSLLFTD